jgi:dTDP-glucose 4,6-dehydratase
MRFLVTGGAGFIGSNYVRHLLATAPEAQVTDHCSAIDLVLRRGQTGAVYNVGAGNEVTNLELTRRILAAFGAGEDRIEFVADRPGHDWRYSLDTARVRELGWAPAHDFDQGLAETIAWYRAHEDWWPPMKPAGASRTLDHGK